MIPITNITGRTGNQMFQHAYIYAQYRKGLIPDIYLQSEEYFKEFKDEIKALYASKTPPLDYVAVHVRRGDYVGNDFYVDLYDDGYYGRAMALFPNKEFLIFSDDPEWCAKQAIFKHHPISRGNSEIDDLNMMAACDGVIIANSSFSWWGGYLSRGRVVAPIKWHTDGVKRTHLPDSWIQI